MLFSLFFFPLQFFFFSRLTIHCGLCAAGFERDALWVFSFSFSFQWTKKEQSLCAPFFIYVPLFLRTCLLCSFILVIIPVLNSRYSVPSAGRRSWVGNCYAEVRFWCPPLPQTPLSLVFPRPLNFFILFFFDIYADVKSIYSLGIGHRSTNVDTPYFFYDYCLFFLFFLLLNITLFFFFFFVQVHTMTCGLSQV